MNPISTAPKDTQILLGKWNTPGSCWIWVASGMVNHDGGLYIHVQRGYYHDNRPVATHWAPMPGDPNKESIIDKYWPTKNPE